MPPSPPQRHDHALLSKVDAAVVTSSPENGHLSKLGGVVAQSTGTTSLTSVDARRKGWAIPRAIVMPSRSTPVPGDLASLPPQPVAGLFAPQSGSAPVRRSKVSLVTSTSSNKTEPTPLTESSLFPDDTPLQTCLEYLTRPHRSWDSANNVRELYRRRTREHYLAIESRSISSSLVKSARLSTTSSNASVSLHSAPPTVGRLLAPPSGCNRKHKGSALAQRGRFGMLPGARPEPEGLAVGGSRLALPENRPPSRLQPLMLEKSVTKAPRHLPPTGLSRSTVTKCIPHDFVFSMQ